MEKDLGRIKKNENTEIVIRFDDYGGKPGLTIREFITSERYTGFTKQGTRIPGEKVAEFKELVASLNMDEFKAVEAAKDKKKTGKSRNEEEETEENSDDVEEEEIEE